MYFSTTAALLGAATLGSAVPLLPRQLGTGSTTANDVKNGVCAPVTLIYARGTSEAGNIGSTVGPALASGLKAKLGNVAIQGVDYPASAAGNAQGGAQGGPTAAQDAELALSQCPSTKIVLGGYSQGAMVATYAVTGGGLDASKVFAAVLFGNPFQATGAKIGAVPASRILSQCAPGDGVCDGQGFAITAAHLSYTSNGDIDKAVTFIQNLVNGAGTGTTSPVTTATTKPVATATTKPTATTTTKATASATTTKASATGLGGLGGIFGGLGSGSSSGSGLGGLFGFGKLSV